MDISQLQSLLGNSAEDKQSALNMGLLQAGLGILANNTDRRNPMPAIAKGGMMGIQGYDNALKTQTATKLQNLQLNQLLKKLQTQDILSKALMGQSSAPVTAPSATPGGMSRSTQEAFGMRYDPAKDTPETPKMTTTGGMSYADTLLAAARQAGDVDAFQEAMKLKMEEKKLAPKFATDVRVVMMNGKPTAVQMADDGTVRVMEGMGPAEKLHFADNGQQIQGLNAFTGAPVGNAIKKQMTPDAVASNALGWANYNKPSIQNVEGVGLMQVGPKGTASPVMLNGKPVVQEKPLTEAQGKAAGFADRMASAERIMGDPKLADAQAPEVLPEILKATPSMGLGGVVGNKIESSDRQKVRQAQEDWVRSALRLESGAVIGKEEMDQEIKTFFPQLGDSPELVEQKRQARILKQQGVARQAGPSYSGRVVDFSQLRN